jgi:hypothetical protein
MAWPAWTKAFIRCVARSTARKTLKAIATFTVSVAYALPVHAEPPAEEPGRWLRGESQHFVIYCDRSEDALREYDAMLEDFDGLLRFWFLKTGQPVGRKLPVYLLSGRGQLRRIRPDATDFAGFYFSSLNDIFAVAIRESASERQGGDDTVLHEYTHHFMMQYLPYSYPAWSVEGVAEYFMTADLNPKRWTVGGFNAGRVYALEHTPWLPMEDLLTKAVSEVREQDLSVYYGQAWLLTHYIFSDPVRRNQFADYLKLVHARANPVTAWAQIYGDDPKQLQHKLWEYLNGAMREFVIKREAPPPPQIKVTRLPAGADDLLLEVQRLKLGVPRDKGNDLLVQIRSAAAKHPNERFSRLALARAETELGDRARGENLLDGLLAEQPDDVEALQLRALSRLAAAKENPEHAAALRNEAERDLGRANKVDPDDYLTLYVYAIARLSDGAVNENTLNVLYRAATLAPQISEIRLTAADVFIHAREYPSAREMLDPVASDPHGGEAGRIAVDMLKTIEPDIVPERSAALPGQAR